MDARIKPKPSLRAARVLLDRWIVRGRMTQGEAADLIGISRVKLNQYLHAEARPSLETAIRIEDTTGIAVRSWLIDEPEPAAVGAVPDMHGHAENS
jgi:transcriptional regulator with XRE-family HTH domain